jgi:hypothetical protein
VFIIEIFIRFYHRQFIMLGLARTLLPVNPQIVVLCRAAPLSPHSPLLMVVAVHSGHQKGLATLEIPFFDRLADPSKHSNPPRPLSNM